MLFLSLVPSFCLLVAYYCESTAVFSDILFPTTIKSYGQSLANVISPAPCECAGGCVGEAVERGYGSEVV